MSDPRTTPSIFTRGAVDLSALRTPAPSPAAAPSRPQTGAAQTGAAQTGAAQTGAASTGADGPNGGAPVFPGGGPETIIDGRS